MIPDDKHWLMAQDVQVGDLVLDYEDFDGDDYPIEDQFYVEHSNPLHPHGMWYLANEDQSKALRVGADRYVEVMR